MSHRITPLESWALSLLSDFVFDFYFCLLLSSYLSDLAITFGILYILGVFHAIARPGNDLVFYVTIARNISLTLSLLSHILIACCRCLTMGGNTPTRLHILWDIDCIQPLHKILPPHIEMNPTNLCDIIYIWGLQSMPQPCKDYHFV